MLLFKINFKRRNLTYSSRRGFTLIELLVTITIFVILTGVVIFNQSKFNSTILLTNLAYDTALTIRQAQNFGINIKEFGAEGKFSPYGVHFDINSNRSFLLFTDINYNSTSRDLTPYIGDTSKCLGSDGCVNRYNIRSGNKISEICVTHGNAQDCDIEQLDILFQRPNPDAIIYADGMVNREYSNAIITLSGGDSSGSRNVEVQINGLIQITQ